MSKPLAIYRNGSITQAPIPPTAEVAMRNKRRILPSDRETAVLRQIARSKLLVTMTEKGPVYCLADGSAVHQKSADKCVRRGWLVPADQPLLGETPQSYVVRKP